MLIWAMLLASFLGGIAVILKGSLNVSQRRQIVGVVARRVGTGMVLLPFLVLAMTYGVMMASQAYGNIRETAATHGMIAGVLLISLAAILLAANAKRWSVSIQTESSRSAHSRSPAKTDQPDFSFLEDPKPQNPIADGES